MKKIWSVFMLYSVLFLSVSMGQQNPYDIWMNPGTDDFETIRRNAENYFSNIDKYKRGSGYKQWKTWEYMQDKRLSEDGKLTNFCAKNFQEYQNYIGAQGSRGTTVTFGSWVSLGPDYFVDGGGWNGGIGRVNCITFHPSNANTFWVGCPAGGLWRTDNGGTTWTPLTDGMPRIGVSGLAVDYTNPGTMYLLTGDGDGAHVYSIGVLKTTNGGETWYSSGLSWDVQDFVQGYKIIMHPATNLILFVVTNQGIYRTANGGSSWTLVHSASNHNYFDIEFKPGDPSVMYACAGTEFYRSTNTGVSWTQVTSGVPISAGRMAIGITPDAPDYVYLFAGPSYIDGTFVGMYRSTNSGVSFSQRATTPNILGYSNVGNDDDDQNGYDHCIAVSRNDETALVTGAINCWKSVNGGSNYTLSSMWDNPPGADYTHADIHALEINPLNNYLYCGSDGGIFRSTDFGENWTDLSNGLSITQTYRFAGTQSNANLLINGTQDNGSNRWNGGSTMLHIRGADGMDCMIDPGNANIFYNTRQNGILEKSTDAGNTYTTIQPSGSTGQWITPIIMNPSNSSTIYGGYDDIYKSTNGGSSWTNLGYCGDGAMAIGTSNTERIYASVYLTRTIYTSSNGGTTFSDVTGNLPNGIITFIAVDPDNSFNVIVTYGCYSAGNKVFQSLNAGTSWTNISGSLPNIPVNCVIYQDTDGNPDDAMYIGTDIGVFYRDVGTGDWVPFMNGLPAVPVMDLEVNYGSNVITAATFGRGFWRSALYSDCPAGYVLTPANNPGNPNYTGFQHYEASDSIRSTRVITGGIGSDVTYQAGNKVRLVQGFYVKEGNVFKAVLGPCDGTAPGPPPMNRLAGGYAGKMPD